MSSSFCDASENGKTVSRASEKIFKLHARPPLGSCSPTLHFKGYWHDKTMCAPLIYLLNTNRFEAEPTTPRRPTTAPQLQACLNPCLESVEGFPSRDRFCRTGGYLLSSYRFCADGGILRREQEDQPLSAKRDLEARTPEKAPGGAGRSMRILKMAKLLSDEEEFTKWIVPLSVRGESSPPARRSFSLSPAALSHFRKSKRAVGAMPDEGLTRIHTEA